MVFFEELKSKPWFLPVVGTVLILFLFYLLFGSTPEPPSVKSRQDARGANQGLYDLKTGSWQNRVDQDLEATKKQLAEIDGWQQEIRDELTNINVALEGLTAQIQADRDSRLAATRATPPLQPKAIESGITVLRFGAARSSATERPVNSKAALPAISHSAYLPGGSMAHSVLLTGIDAPVGGKPFPVLLALKKAFASPNSYQVPLKGCFALGKVEGNASSERADIQIVRMSCVLPNGKAFEQDITGYVVGGDGKQGIPGKLVDKEGRKVALAAVAGVAAGLARAFGQQQVTNVVTESGAITSTVTGDAVTFGLASGAQGAATELQRYFHKQAERLFPVVEVDAGKDVTLVMLSGIKVPGLEVANKVNIRSGLD